MLDTDEAVDATFGNHSIKVSGGEAHLLTTINAK
jgi:hypothetical protein